MNLGKSLNYIGWLLKAGCKQEQFAKEGTAPDEPIGQPFLGALDHETCPSSCSKAADWIALVGFGSCLTVQP